MGIGAIKAGTAFVEATLNDAKLQRGLKRAKRQLQGFGASVAKVGGAITGAGAAVLTPFIGSIAAASKAETVAGKFAIVFGENTEAVKAWGAAYAEEVGRSETQVKGFLSGVQDFFVPLGFEEGAATKMSKELTKLAFDLGSFNDEATDEGALKDLQAALTGSGEVMKKYGVLVDEASVKQEILNQGLDPKAATTFQKVHARYAIILRGTTKAQGNAIASAGEWANVQKRVGATMTNLREVIGRVAIDALKPYAAQAIVMMKAAKSWAENNKGLLKTILKVGAALVVLGVVVSAIGFGIIILGAAVGGIGAIFSALATVLGIVSTVATAMWATMLGPAIAAVAVFGLVFANVLALSGGLDDLAESGATAFQTIKGDAMKAGDVIRQAFAAGDIGGALKVALALIKLEWARFASSIKGGTERLWIDMKTLWTAGTYSIVEVWIKALSRVKKEFIDMRASLRAGMIAVSVGDPNKAIAGLIANETKRKEEQLERTDEEDLKLGVAEAIKDTKLDELKKKGWKAEAKAEKAVAKALAKFNAALAEVSAEAEKAKEKPKMPGGQEDPGAGAIAAGVTIASGFSAAAINRSLGRPEKLDKKAFKEQQKIERNTARTNMLLKNIADATKHNPGMVFL